MVDTQIAATVKAYKTVPLQAHLRIVWFVFCLGITIVWTRIYYDESVHEKRCFVQENQDGTYSMLTYMDEGLVSNKENITNVSQRFEYLSVSYLAQGVLSLITVSYQLVAIYFINSLLMYRHYISRVNKLILLYGAYILFMTHLYRLDEPGHLCSGDYLTEEEKMDPSISKQYLLELGRLFWAYMMGIWVLSILAGLFCVVIGYQVYTTFT